MFSEYVDELQNPDHRAETEAYISQLEGENKVPAGKELIRPNYGFVAKTYKLVQGEQTEKVFINIVQSEKIKAPSQTSTANVLISIQLTFFILF
jgi:dynein assembly factor 2